VVGGRPEIHFKNHNDRYVAHKIKEENKTRPTRPEPQTNVGTEEQIAPTEPLKHGAWRGSEKERERETKERKMKEPKKSIELK